VISNQASRNGAARAQSAARAASALGKLIGGASLVLALCASAPRGALAQSSPPPASDAVAAAPAATASPGAALPGASIRKPPVAASADGAASAGDAAAGAAPAAGGVNADGDVAAPAAAMAPAGAGGAPAPSAPAGVASSSEIAAPPAPAMPGTAASAIAPAALATPGAHTGARAKAAGRGRAPRRAHSGDAAEPASLQTASKDAKADSKDDSGGKDSPFSSLQFSGNKGPVDIKSDSLDLDYKGNIVTFRGHVHATQADATLTSDSLTVFYGKDFHEVKQMVANNNVRMSQGTRWATGDHAVLDQAKHTVTLTGSPVVHDGEDQVAGSKITVHLDSGKSEVEGARAVFFPKDQKTRDNKTTVAKSP
jgi:lipopolysaccharide transport protein LptA